MGNSLLTIMVLWQLENREIVSGWDNWLHCIMHCSLDTFVFRSKFGQLSACRGSLNYVISSGTGQKSNLCERSSSKSTLELIDLLSVCLRWCLNKTCPFFPPSIWKYKRWGLNGMRRDRIKGALVEILIWIILNLFQPLNGRQLKSCKIQN